jgi:hypothetical protein
LNKLIIQADYTLNSTQASQLFKQVDQIAVDLYMYVYTYQSNGYWVVKPYITPYQNDISYQSHPIIAGAGASLFFWWNKG